MRTHGTLTRWNDARGFGFITPAQGSADVFVHISAFPRGSRPHLGEVVSFEIEMGPNGKSRALRLMRPDASRQRPPRSSERKPSGIAGALVGGALIVLLAVYAFDRARRPQVARLGEPPALPKTAAQAESFSCDGRTACPQMTSCAEAVFFLQHCPGAAMDGDDDGEPCEQQWCN